MKLVPSGLVVLVLLVLALLPAASAPPEDPATAARDEFLANAAAWDAARVAFDRAALEGMLAPDFHVVLAAERLTRAQFLEEISTRRPGVVLRRFDTELLTLTPEGEDWTAVVSEKMEVVVTGPDGRERTFYSLWITRDRFRGAEHGWLALSSEEIGHESWSDAPPFDDWAD